RRLYALGPVGPLEVDLPHGAADHGGAGRPRPLGHGVLGPGRTGGRPGERPSLGPAAPSPRGELGPARPRGGPRRGVPRPPRAPSRGPIGRAHLWVHRQRHRPVAALLREADWVVARLAAPAAPPRRPGHRPAPVVLPAPDAGLCPVDDAGLAMR